MNKDVRFKITAENKTEAGVKAARKSLNSLGKAGALAGVAFGAAIIAGYASASAEIDKLAKTSSYLDIPAKELQILRHQADLTGVSIKTLETGLKKMSSNVSGAVEGTGAAADALKQLGIDAAQLNKLKPQDQMRQIADAMEKVGNNNDRINLANSIFGGRGAEMINSMKGGAAAIDAAGEELKKYGLLLSEIDTRKIEIANDNMERSQKVFKGVTNQIAIQFAPIVNELTNRFLKMAEEVGGVDNLVRKFIGYGVKGFGVMADGVHGLKLAFLGVRAYVASLLSMMLEIPRVASEIGGKFAEKIGLGPREENQMIASFQETAKEISAQFQNELMAEIPSARVQEWWTDLNDKFTEQAQTLVRNQGLDVGQVAIEGVQKLSVSEDSDPYGFGKDDPFLTAEEIRQQKLADIRTRWREQNLSQELEAQAKLMQFQEMATSSKVKTLISEGVQITQGAANTSKKLFKMNKALALADAAVTLPSAVLKAVERGGGWPWGAAFGALTLANGMAQINAIKGANFSGGGGTSASLAGSGGGAIPTTSAPSTTQSQTGGTESRGTMQFIIQGDVFGMDDFEDKILTLISHASDTNAIRITNSQGRQFIERT
jgi:hypothetical protein